MLNRMIRFEYDENSNENHNLPFGIWRSGTRMPPLAFDAGRPVVNGFMEGEGGKRLNRYGTNIFHSIYIVHKV